MFEEGRVISAGMSASPKINDLEKLFREFILRFRIRESTIYETQLAENVRANRFVLNVRLQDITAFNNQLSDDLVKHPLKTIPSVRKWFCWVYMEFLWICITLSNTMFIFHFVIYLFLFYLFFFFDLFYFDLFLFFFVIFSFQLSAAATMIANEKKDTDTPRIENVQILLKSVDKPIALRSLGVIFCLDMCFCVLL
jgi:hypothetical protein